MPLRIFTRRKSSTNAFEQLHTPPEPSFRVLDRPQRQGSAAFHGGDKLKRSSIGPSGSPVLAARSEEDISNTDRGSGGTTNSIKGGHPGSSSSSARLSSSTLPSSADADSSDEYIHDQKPAPSYHNVPSHSPAAPEPRQTFSFSAAARTLSFGGPKLSNKSSLSSVRSKEPVKSSSGASLRDRAMTASSYASTARPPQLEGADFGFGASDLGTGFGDIFDGFAKRKSTVFEEPEDEAAPQTVLRVFSSPMLQTKPSWYQGDERRGLVSSSEAEPPVPPPHQPRASISPLQPVQAPRHVSLDDGPDTKSGLSRHRRDLSSVSSARYSTVDNEDARLLVDTVQASRTLGKSGGSNIPLTQRSSEKLVDRDVAPETQTQNTSGNDDDPISLKVRFIQSTPEASEPAPQQEESLFDGPAFRSPRRTSQNRQPSTPLKQSRTGNKVMTPSQFEYYKNRQAASKQKEDEEEEDSTYEEEDEMERLRRDAKERRKRAANLVVHRQQMMKLTGETVDELPIPKIRRNMGHASQSMPNLTRLASSSLDTSPEEDEDVPLGILAAHGFPNKNRPPNRLRSELRPVTQLSNYPASPGSVAGDALGGRATSGNLPVFARNLPSDPYFGASLVNPVRRESLAFANHAGGSVVGVPTSPGIPRGGLVGVIAGEERARAMRRGSPNAVGGYGPLPTARPMPNIASAFTPHGPFDSGMPTMAHMDPTTQQFTMLQMQMQMMQMMQQMQGGLQQQSMQRPQPPPFGQPPPFPPQQQPFQQQHINPAFLAAPGMHRPSSMLYPGQRPMSLLDPQQSWQGSNHQRSTYAPSVQPPNGNGTDAQYTASIAPSERSNVGLPSRYRPVSVKGEHVSGNPGTEMESMSRSSTFSSATVLVGAGAQAAAGGATIRAVEKAKGAPRLHSAFGLGLRNGAEGEEGNEEEEEEKRGWEEMRRRRDDRKTGWVARKRGEWGIGE